MKGEYKSGYQRQLDFYVYLLKQQNLNIEISDYAYLYVVNTRGLDEKFDNKLLFESTLITAKIRTDYLENEIDDRIDFGGVMTSSFFLTPIKCIPKVSASVPLLRATAYFVEVNLQIFSSNLIISLPPTQSSELIVLSINFNNDFFSFSHCLFKLT